MYSSKKIVGDFFEERVVNLFDLVRIDENGVGLTPDLVSKKGEFFVEVKGSAYNNGGVIKQRQLYRFDRDIAVRRFYAFGFHSIASDMERLYPNEERLKKALDVRSVFLFPFSIVKAHYERSKKRYHHQVDFFVQLRESLAQAIFSGDSDAWKHLGIESGGYKKSQPHKKVHILTTDGALEKKILTNFHPEFLY